MYFEIYDYISGDLINRSSVLDFGDIIQNQHTNKPIVARAFKDSENTITDFKIYLEDKGSWQDSDFGYYISPSFKSSIESGSNKLNHFIEVPNATISSPNGVPIGWDTTSSYFFWLDAQIKIQIGINRANFRFFYNYT